jgi:transcriptional regulator with XRE-family HTH domain
LHQQFNENQNMPIANNLKELRIDRGYMQKDVYSGIGLKPAHYNKLEKGLIDPSVQILDKLATYYGVTIDEIVHYSKATPAAVTMEDKTATEQLRLIAQLNDKDKSTVMNIIDTMLTKQKFQTFFEQNLQAAK